MELWLKEIEGEHTRQTIAQHRMAINQFMAFHPGATTAQSLDQQQMHALLGQTA
jgi:hypothetical protein